jgi:hypothetical protein
MGFPFLFAICAAAMIAICFVDVEKGREDGRKFTERRKVDRVAAETGLSADAIIKGKGVMDSGEMGSDVNGNGNSSTEPVERGELA